MTQLKKHYQDKVAIRLKQEFKIKNDLSLPRLLKIVINSGVGRREEKEIEAVQKYLEIITGQKCVFRKARKAISTFKTRKGQVVGLSCTLRGKRMYDFLDRLINAALPRLRDFRGIDPKSIDSEGNLTLGFKEHIVFPEIAGEEVKTFFGFEITLTVRASSREQAEALYQALGIPFSAKSVKGGSGGKK
ncbi:MAG: 50S ribosomal protein L5 [Patescibacteria group bacterium]